MQATLTFSRNILNVDKEIDPVTASLRPGLAPACKLYYDAMHKRWVMRGPNQVVFPDADSLQVLLLCNGERSINQISRKLSKAPNEATEEDTSAFDIIMRFLKRGFLEMPQTDSSAQG
jgi:hypothetical protein